MIRDFTDSDKLFFIAEVGQNHQGDLEMARKYIRIFAMEGANAVKFQTRANKQLFSDDSYNAQYNSENAFAETYGSHREKLELKSEWLPILKKDCQEHGVYFMSTPFDEPSLELLLENDVDILKIASFDIGNLPFIDKIAASRKPIVMSIGGGKSDQIRDSVDVALSYGSELVILHCVSEYPTDYTRLGLDNIERLKKDFPQCIIGSSDHFNGILSGPVAYMKGARVFEKHVTFNRAWKGSDHSFALEQEGFRKFVRDTERVRFMLPPKPEDEIGKEKVFDKLGKSLVAAYDLEEGATLDFGKLSGKIFNKTFIPVRESNKVIGSILNSSVKKGEPITYDLLAKK